MNDTPKKAPRLQHVVLHVNDDPAAASHSYDDVHVFGTELEALRFMIGERDLEYVAVPHGASVRDALNAEAGR